VEGHCIEGCEVDEESGFAEEDEHEADNVKESFGDKEVSAVGREQEVAEDTESEDDEEDDGENDEEKEDEDEDEGTEEADE
jgi:hypothetical protein